MNFEEKINYYEKLEKKDYDFKCGNTKVLLTAVHTMEQLLKDRYKRSEPFTKEIVEYVSEETKAYHYIKNIDNGIDSNSVNEDIFKKNLIDYIKKYDIKLLIDFHGSRIDRDFDIEMGTLNNLTADFSTLKELEEAFKHNGINKVIINTNFKGGGITQYVYANTNIDVIQLEINAKYRDANNILEMKKLCDSLIYFINQYNNK